MLYFKALADGIDAMPAADPARARGSSKPTPPRSAGRRCTRGSPRSIRSPPRGWRPTTASASSARWRVWHASGQPLSQLSCGAQGRQPRTPAGRRAAGLARAHRARLAARAHRRALRRHAGRRLHRRGAGAARARRPGDRPALDALRRLPPGLGSARRRAAPIAELRERGIAATRQLAKRQITWLRSMPQRHVIAGRGTGRDRAGGPPVAGKLA